MADLTDWLYTNMDSLVSTALAELSQDENSSDTCC